MKLLLRCGAALTGGLVLAFAFAPYGWWPLAFVSPAVLLLALQDSDPRHAFLIGWCYGLGLFGHGIWWIQISVHQFGIPYYLFSVSITALLIIAMALYPAAFAALLVQASRRGLARVFVAPALWVLLEVLRGWLFSGFPWLALGYSQIDAPLSGYAPVLGVYACSGLVMLTAVAALELRSAATFRRLRLVLLIVAVFSVGQVLRGVEFTRPLERGLSVALIQGAIPQALKWRPELREASIKSYLALSAAHWDADVVIWPETAIAAFPHEVPEVLAELAATARDTHTDLLLGMPTGEPWNDRYYNSLVDLGASPGQYDKRHLVPFGEFFPLKSVVGGIASLLQIPVSDFSAGSDRQAPLEVAGHAAAISICYEDAFGSEVAATLPSAAVLINISNDAWFGDSIAPHQHLEIARMRALETGRWLLRGTNTGITAIIDHHGDVTARAPQFIATSLRGHFDARSGATPYVRYKDWPVIGLVAVALLITPALRRRARRAAAKP